MDPSVHPALRPSIPRTLDTSIHRSIDPCIPASLHPCLRSAETHNANASGFKTQIIKRRN
eukprot:15291735-Alexandrium_andersonii.AAC.1